MVWSVGLDLRVFKFKPWLKQKGIKICFRFGIFCGLLRKVSWVRYGWYFCCPLRKVS